MTFGLREHGVAALVLDIEGTTTPLTFVHDVLFPFARTHLREYLDDRRTADRSRESVARLRDEWMTDQARGEEPPDWPARAVPDDAVDRPARVAAYAEWLMDRDRKSPGLKELQGLIWERGYRDSVLKGDVFPDVAPAFERWCRAGADVAIYSSGSELAQRLLFGSTPDGDLTRFIRRFFDTAVGPKISPASYVEIALRLGCAASTMLFVSDVTTELAAAREAGCQTLLSVRPGNRLQPAGEFGVMKSFDEIT